MRSRSARDPERSGGRRTRAPAHTRPRLCLAHSRHASEIGMAAVVSTATIASTPQESRRPSRFFTRLFRDKPLGAAGGMLLLIFVGVGLTAQWIAPYGYNEIAPIHRLKAPSWEHWFGTDNLGRDLLSRCIYGAQLSV